MFEAGRGANKSNHSPPFFLPPLLSSFLPLLLSSSHLPDSFWGKLADLNTYTHTHAVTRGGCCSLKPPASHYICSYFRRTDSQSFHSPLFISSSSSSSSSSAQVCLFSFPPGFRDKQASAVGGVFSFFETSLLVRFSPLWPS